MCVLRRVGSRRVIAATGMIPLIILPGGALRTQETKIVKTDAQIENRAPFFEEILKCLKQ
jgi:hypothetical protein